MEENKTPQKEKATLITENPVFIEKKKELENYLNKKSRIIFIIMLVLIALSLFISIFLSLTREPKEFAPGSGSIELPNARTEIEKFNSLYYQYKQLREDEKKVDSLLIQIQKEYEN